MPSYYPINPYIVVKATVVQIIAWLVHYRMPYFETMSVGRNTYYTYGLLVKKQCHSCGELSTNVTKVVDENLVQSLSSDWHTLVFNWH